MTQQHPKRRARFSPHRQLIAGTIGHAVEFFDFLAYTYLAVYFASSFFPSDSSNSLVPLLNSFGVFAVGFLARPLAGLFIGNFADRFGRRRAMSLSITMMGGGSLLIAACPTYAQIGVLAPTVLVIARVLQGLSAGGEYTSASAFLVESAPPGRRGVYSSFMCVASSIGKLVTLGFIAVLVPLLGKEAMIEYGWRIPFAVGALAALVAWWIRQGTDETLSATESTKAAGHKSPFDALRRYPRQALQVFALTSGIAVGQYLWATYMTTYFEIRNGASATAALVVGVVALSLYIMFQPLAGGLSDKIGRKPVLYVFGMGSALTTVPLLMITSANPWALLFMQLSGLLILSFATSVLSAVMVEMFPPYVRAAGLGFPYSLSVALFGGTIPIVATALQEADRAEYLGWYVAAVSLITFIAAVTLRETSKADIFTSDLPADAADDQGLRSS